MSDELVADTATYIANTRDEHSCLQPNSNPQTSKPAVADPRFTTRGHRERRIQNFVDLNESKHSTPFFFKFLFLFFLFIAGQDIPCHRSSFVCTRSFVTALCLAKLVRVQLHTLVV